MDFHELLGLRLRSASKTVTADGANVMTRMLVRIEFNETGSSMSPITAKLLERIREHGSIRKAAASLGMGYRHSWSLIRGLQDALECRIVATATGGNDGGGTA